MMIVIVSRPGGSRQPVTENYEQQNLATRVYRLAKILLK